MPAGREDAAAVGDSFEAVPEQTARDRSPGAGELSRGPDEETVLEPSAAGRGPGSEEPPGSPPPAWQSIDWESWLGVRGAAVLGGAVLALAGLFFFRYSIEHGLLPPWVRVLMGIGVGVASLGLSEWALRREYAGTANGLAGAGVVVLYAAFWAAGPLYGLTPPAVTFVALSAVTVACCALSWRHRSQVIATIGLVGGFLTPLFASSGSDRPVGLFAYVLVLDAALLYTGRRNRWPSLAILSLLGTFVYEALWIGTRMGPDRLLLGLAILGVFALVFAFASGPVESPGRGWFLTRAGGVLLPFGFAVYFALRGELGPSLLPIGLLLLLLSAAAGFLARVHAAPLLGAAAAAAGVGVLGVWVMTQTVTVGAAWVLMALCALLALVFHLYVEWQKDEALWSGPAAAALVAALGLGLVLCVAALSSSSAPFWPWYCGWLALGALVIRQAALAGRGWWPAAVAVSLAAGLMLLEAAHGGRWAFPAPSTFLAVLLATAVGFQVVAMARPSGAPRGWAEHAAASFATLALVALVIGRAPDQLPALLYLGATLALGTLVNLAATRLGGSLWSLAATLATALAHSGWAVNATPTVATVLALFFSVLVFTAWPFVVLPRVGSDAWAWRAAALAGPAWFMALGASWEERFGDVAIGLMPLLLGAITLAAAARARTVFAPDDPLQKTRLAWLLGITLGFVTVAIPLQLEREWITVAWALEGLALIVLWERLDHPGLKYVALALFAVVTLRLVVNVEVLSYHPRGSWRIVNWLLYTYLVPAGALIVASRRLATLELARLREVERRWYVRPQPLGAALLGLAGLAVVFAWLNLAIADWFATGSVLEIDFHRLPARDLTTSIAWGLYALCLLALGVRQRSPGLRWASLVLLLVTIGKVFLHDVGELEDLYRVASLVGLAISLILVSLAYQRFVLRERSEAR